MVGVIASRAEKEPEALAGIEQTFRRGYIAEMNTKHPQTIGYGSMDSPVAMAAWMLDHDPDSYAKISKAFLDGQPTGGLTRDQRPRQHHALLADQHRDVGGAALLGELPEHRGRPRLRAEGAGAQGLDRASRSSRSELFKAPRSWAEKVYPNLTYFNEAAKGGHFAAWEEPRSLRRS